MEKQIVEEFIDFDFSNWTYGAEISKIKEDIALLEQLGATHIDISSDISYGSCSIEIKATKERPETDKEFTHRINSIKSEIERQKQKEIEFLKQLKLKYPNE